MWAGEKGAESSVIHHGSGRRGVFEAFLAMERRGEAQAPCFSSWRMGQQSKIIPSGNCDSWRRGELERQQEKGSREGGTA